MQVQLTHKSLVSNIMQISNTGLMRSQYEREVSVGLLPFSHIYGMNCIMNFGLSRGCTLLLIDKLDPGGLLLVLAKYKVNVTKLADYFFSL